jgi:hypothetical protein
MVLIIICMSKQLSEKLGNPFKVSGCMTMSWLRPNLRIPVNYGTLSQQIFLTTYVNGTEDSAYARHLRKIFNISRISTNQNYKAGKCARLSATSSL